MSGQEQTRVSQQPAGSDCGSGEQGNPRKEVQPDGPVLLHPVSEAGEGDLASVGGSGIVLRLYVGGCKVAHEFLGALDAVANFILVRLMLAAGIEPFDIWQGMVNSWQRANLWDERVALAVWRHIFEFGWVDF